MRVVEPTTWARQEVFAYYRGFADPTFDLTVEVPIEGLPERARAEGRSQFAATLHALGCAIHTVEPFRMRIRGDQVVVHDVVHPGFVTLTDAGQLRFCGVRWEPDAATFAAIVSDATSKARGSPLVDAHPGDDAFYVSAMPWLTLRGVRHARAHPTPDSIPRFAWGRHAPGVALTLCVSAHHALVDGRHVADLVDAMRDAARR